jgi:hypothetical protein
VLALALTIPMVGAARPGPRLARVARSGVDLVLVAVAVAAWWQLHSQRPTETTGDATLILAPVVCVVAVTVLAIRVRELESALAEEVLNRPGRRVFAAGSEGDVVSLRAGERAKKQNQVVVWRPMGSRGP